jgi:uncharacterized protein YjbI with pentapeptide repeats
MATYNQKQFDILKKCNENKDITEWNAWRSVHPDEIVSLQNANLTGYYLKGALLRNAHLEGAGLNNANLEDADLREAHLESATLKRAHLDRARLIRAHIGGAIFEKTLLKDAKFIAASGNGKTLFWDCEINENTDFRGVGLASVRINPIMRQNLEGFIRLNRWQKWYKRKPPPTKFHVIHSMLWKAFWIMSDYGRSTGRIIKSFFLLSFCFALTYYVWAVIDYKLFGKIENSGIITNLLIGCTDPIRECIFYIIRALYFSIVTMTTLGFGDMHAANDSWAGHIFLIIQVLLGYILLGALVTRFAILFTFGGPPDED